MNLEHLFCPHIDCPARGQTGEGNLVIHSQQEERCCCTACGKTFAVTKGTLFYWLCTDPKIETRTKGGLTDGSISELPIN